MKTAALVVVTVILELLFLTGCAAAWWLRQCHFGS
jgi:hypothetical protein